MLISFFLTYVEIFTGWISVNGKILKWRSRENIYGRGSSLIFTSCAHVDADYVISFPCDDCADTRMESATRPCPDMDLIEFKCLFKYQNNGIIKSMQIIKYNNTSCIQILVVATLIAFC